MAGDMNALIASCSEYTYLTQGKRIDGNYVLCTSLGVKIGEVLEQLLWMDARVQRLCRNKCNSATVST